MKVVRAVVTCTLVAGLLLVLGRPLCFTSACRMSAAERPACKTMGRECCGTKGGHLSQVPAAPPPSLAPAAAALADAVQRPLPAPAAPSSRPPPPPPPGHRPRPFPPPSV